MGKLSAIWIRRESYEGVFYGGSLGWGLSIYNRGWCMFEFLMHGFWSFLF